MIYELNLSKTLICTASGRVFHKRENATSRAVKIKKKNLFICCIDGMFEIIIDTRRYTANKGDIFIIPKGMPYKFSAIRNCEYYYFHFSGNISTCEQFPSFWYEREHYTMYSPTLISKSIYFPEKINLNERYEDFVGRINKCIRLVSEPYHTSQMLFNTEFQKILIMISAMFEPGYNDEKEPHILKKMTEYIQKNISSVITVSDIAEKFQISPSYVARLFKRWYNISPSRYIQQEKMYYARALLSYGTMNVSEVATFIGFSNVYYFSRVYKNIFGCSPTKDMHEA